MGGPPRYGPGYSKSSFSREADFRALWESRGVKPEEVEKKLKRWRPE